MPDCNRNLPQFAIADFPTIGGLAFNGSENPTYSFKDDLSWTRGKHTFKSGYLFEYAPYVGLGQQYGAGLVNFTVNNTALPGQSSRNVGGGLGFASFLLGVANSGRIMTPKHTDMRWRYHAMYFQDDWRVAPHLTVNLGMRYEFNLPALNGGDRCADFNPTKPNPGASDWLGALDFCGMGPGRRPPYADRRVVQRLRPAPGVCLECHIPDRRARIRRHQLCTRKGCRRLGARAGLPD